MHIQWLLSTATYAIERLHVQSEKAASREIN